jgi:Ca2+-transporting ATPase
LTDKKYYSESLEDVYAQLETSVKGLSSEEAARRLAEYGLNELSEEEKTTAFDIFLNQFKSILILILLLAAAVSGLVLREYTDMGVILVIILLNSVIGFIQEYRAEQAVEALKKMVSPTCSVIRDGAEQEVDATKVVLGDIILLQDGDRVPADGRVIDAATLKIDESPLTGESTTVTKKPDILDDGVPLAQRQNMVYMGTHVTYGRGKAVITTTSMETEFGTIADLIQSIPEEESPLKKKTEALGRRLI